MPLERTFGREMLMGLVRPWKAKVSPLLIAASVLAVAAPAAAAPHNARVWALAKQNRTEQLKFLESLVNIDSGTGDLEGGAKVAALLSEELRAAGAAVSTSPPEAPGIAPNLVATFSGTGEGRLLLIGHLDTVFEPGTAAKRPFARMRKEPMDPASRTKRAGWFAITDRIA